MANIKKNNTPKLRFSEFTDEWKEQKLSEVVTFSKGSTLSKADLSEKGHPCILYGELYTKYNEVITNVTSRTNSTSDKLAKGYINDILIPSSGETAIDIACASALEVNEVFLGGDLNILRPKKSINGPFLSYILNHVKKRELAKVAQGATVVHLYNENIKNVSVFLPEAKEQQKIASFFFLFNQKIERQQNKIEQLELLKNSMMEKIFSQEFRFKSKTGQGFTDWQVTTLGNISTFFSGGTPRSTNIRYYNGNIPFIRSAEIDLSKTELFISKEGLENSSAKMVRKGDLLMALYGANSGEISISKIEGAINQAILCIRTEESVDYIKYYWQYKKNNIVNTYLQGGQGNLSATIVKNVEILLPSFEEQQMIGKYFSTLELKINKEKEKLETLIQLKKGFIQQMFI